MVVLTATGGPRLGGLVVVSRERVAELINSGERYMLFLLQRKREYGCTEKAREKEGEGSEE